MLAKIPMFSGMAISIISTVFFIPPSAILAPHHLALDFIAGQKSVFVECLDNDQLLHIFPSNSYCFASASRLRKQSANSSSVAGR